MRFLLIDGIESLLPGSSIVAFHDIGSDEEYFRDHFPGFPVVPGVLLTEMMAQAAGKCLDAERRPRGKAMLAKITSASFREWVKPGQRVVLCAAVTASRDSYAKAECHAEVDGRKVAEAKLLFSFLPSDQFLAGYRDDILEDYLAGHEA